MRESVTIAVPGDKSISHRALILATLAQGRSRIRGILESEDVLSTARVLRMLGANVPALSAEIEIDGTGFRSRSTPAGDVECGNSGTTVRLLAGIVAGTHSVSARFTGDHSLSSRPMRRVADPLTMAGARFEFERDDGLPMTVHGAQLNPMNIEMEIPSAQVKSALLLAGLVSGVTVSVLEPVRSRDHTERMLRAMGATLQSDGSKILLDPPSALNPLDITVPGDPSSASYLAAAGVLAGLREVLLPDVCLNDTRTRFFRALAVMGADFRLNYERFVGGEPVGTIRARPSGLVGIGILPQDIPSMIDELPLLCCVAACAAGTTVVSGAAELRVKESDRLTLVVENLRSLGADAEEQADGMLVRGATRPLRGLVRTAGDHRIAMSFGVLSRLPGNNIEIDDRACVAISYPGFWSDLDRATSPA
ncbi:MAG: 3-phosphoshikimate 1-carboxyvinyltransferase [Gemmatimonadaceae bacterium]